MIEAFQSSIELQEKVAQHPQVIQWQMDGHREFWICSWRMRGIEPPHWENVLDHARHHPKSAGVVVVPYLPEARMNVREDHARRVVRHTYANLNLLGELCIGPSFRLPWAPKDYLTLALDWLENQGHKVFLQYDIERS